MPTCNSIALRNARLEQLHAEHERLRRQRAEIKNSIPCEKKERQRMRDLAAVHRRLSRIRGLERHAADADALDAAAAADSKAAIECAARISQHDEALAANEAQAVRVPLDVLDRVAAEALGISLEKLTLSQRPIRLDEESLTLVLLLPIGLADGDRIQLGDGHRA